jgi:hypothetical protein
MSAIDDTEYFQDPIYGDVYPLSECILVEGKFKFYFNSLWEWFIDIKKFTNPITNMDFSNDSIIFFVLKAKEMNKEKPKLQDDLMEDFLKCPKIYFELCLNPNYYLKKKNMVNKSNIINKDIYISPELQKELETKYNKYKTRYMELDLKSKLGVILTKEKYEMNRIFGKVNYDKFYNKLGLKL